MGFNRYYYKYYTPVFWQTFLDELWDGLEYLEDYNARCEMIQLVHECLDNAEMKIRGKEGK